MYHAVSFWLWPRGQARFDWVRLVSAPPEGTDPDATAAGGGATTG